VSDKKTPPAETATEKAEAAAIRRRWITLGEVLAVIAVVISGLTLWSNWSERNEAAAAKKAESHKESARAVALVLVASGSGSGELALSPASGEQTVQSQTIMFPAALDVDPAETTGEPRIEASWFDSELNKAREAAGLPDDSRGDERLPVVIITRFLVDGDVHEDAALYDIGYTVAGRLIGGHDVSLRGVSLVSRVKKSDAQARLDVRWKTLMPTAP
jgi:hypothetical protein